MDNKAFPKNYLALKENTKTRIEANTNAKLAIETHDKRDVPDTVVNTTEEKKG